MEEYRIRAINTGYVLISAKNYQFHHSVHTYLKDVSLLDSPLPVYCFLVENDETKILVDTGMSDTERANTIIPAHGRKMDRMFAASLPRLALCPKRSTR